jgi:ferredoxin-NADP reductase
MKLTLVAKRREADDVSSFLFRSEAPFSWRAGQFLHYSLPHPDADARGTMRYFTIASAPFERAIMLTTRFARGRGSSFKRALQQLPIGATVDVSAPDGDFVIDASGQERVMIAGGIGITPFRAMLLDLDHHQLPISATVLYANRGSDVVYKAELEGLLSRHPGLAFRYVISPARLTEASIRAAAPDLAKPIFYVSGPESFVEALGSTLSGLGVPNSHVMRDYFPGYDGPEA